MRSANNVGNAGPHVRQTLLNDVLNDTNQGRRVFYFINFLGAFHSKRSSYASQYIQIYLFS
jgi:hypothetical protein